MHTVHINFLVFLLTSNAKMLNVTINRSHANKQDGFIAIYLCFLILWQNYSKKFMIIAVLSHKGGGIVKRIACWLQSAS